MKGQLTELLNTLYEAEGLVEMALRRRAQASDRVVRLVVDKCYEVARQAAEIKLPDNADDNAAGQADAPLYAVTPEPETADAADMDAAAEEEEAVQVFTNEVLPKADAFSKHTDINDASIFDDGDTPAEQPEADPAPRPSVLAETPQAVTHGFAHKPAKPLIGFFSINDKFRFRRELYAGSDADMRESLAHIEGLADADQARSYCCRLGWDPESRVVQDFLTIIERYFNS